MAHQPIVSIITPARKAVETLDRMFASVGRQSLYKWEHCIIVNPNDAETREAVQQRAEMDSRIRLVLADCPTAGSARNEGLQHCSGQYVLFLDADDTIGSRHLTRLVDIADSRSAEVVVSGYRRVRTGGRVIARREPSWPVGTTIASGQPTALHAMLFSKDLIDRLSGFDAQLRTNEDWDLCLRAVEIGANFARSDTMTADYWTGHSSLSSDIDQLIADRLSVIDRAVQFAEENEANAWREQEALRTALWCGALAISRGRDTSSLLSVLDKMPAAFASPAEAVEALLNGFSVGFACRENEIAKRLADKRSGHWAALEEFLENIADRLDDKGFEIAVLRRFEADLVRVSGGGRPTRIGDSVVAGGLGLLKPLPKSVQAEQVVVRLPLIRPRRYATHVFAPQVAAGRVPLVLAGQRIYTRTVKQAVCGSNTLGNLRVKAVEAARASRRFLRPPLAIGKKLLGRSAPDPQEAEDDSQWENIFSSEDPWNYTSHYEMVKYERTLGLLPNRPIERALELACAEGLFTKMLAPRVSELTAADISPTALKRAERRCHKAGLDNIFFRVMDFFKEDLEGTWDLIVSSEVLYYMDGPEALARYIRNVAKALSPDGIFLHAHAYQTTDSPNRTAFDWGDNFSVTTISRVFGEEQNLVLERAIETELYRIELYRKCDAATHKERASLAKVEVLSALEGLHDKLAADTVWNGAIQTRYSLVERTYRVPVLLYHGIASDGPKSLTDWRVDPESFERQLIFLRRRGYYSASLEDIEQARQRGSTLSGRPIIITFDDGYRDFAETAWPILKRNGFYAHVMLVSDLVGQAAHWDAYHGEPQPLMDWATISRLAKEGVTFGSHLQSHRALTRLTYAEAEAELVASRKAIEEHTGHPVTSVAPPFGIVNAAFEDLAWRTGYQYLFGVDGGLMPIAGTRMKSPRIEIHNHTTLDDFADAICAVERPDGRDHK